MDKQNLLHITRLLNQANHAGLKVNFDASGLYLKYPKGQKIDPTILKALKANKEEIVRYFKQLNSHQDKEKFDERQVPVKKLIRGSDELYEVALVQHNWLDDSVDTEFKEEDSIHGTVTMTYQILGDFKVDLFHKSIVYLVSRHESLRTTFHKLKGKYYMKIESVSSFSPEYIDLRGVAITKEEVERLSHFETHRFNLEKGPVFLVRLLHLEASKFLLSMMAHHVIFDTISEEILLRDLYVSYSAFRSGREPDLPVLNYQYKENLSIINHFAKTYRQAHRAYWNTLFPKFPNKIRIPGTSEKKRKMSDRISKSETFKFSNQLTERLKQLALEYSTSFFVILQTTFKIFLFSISGHNDILIGTDVFGRDFQSCNNQIGCYAKIVFLRTIFDSEDSLFDAILRVKKSNEDMQQYSAFTLIESMAEKLAPGERFNDKFWNVNLQYLGNHTTSYSRSDTQKMNSKVDFTVSQILGPSNLLIPVDMILKFLHGDQVLRLRVEYDSSLYNQTVIRNFIKQYITHTQEVTATDSMGVIN